MTKKKGIDIGFSEPFAAPGKTKRKKPRPAPTIHCPGADLEPLRQLLLREERLSRNVVVWLVHG